MASLFFFFFPESVGEGFSFKRGVFAGCFAVPKRPQPFAVLPNPIALGSVWRWTFMVG